MQRIDFNYDADFANIRINAGTQIASGYAHKLDPAGLVLGPAGLAHFIKTDSRGNKHDDLFVANSADNTIYMVNVAGWTTTGVTGNNMGTAINVVETVTDPNTNKTSTVNPLHGPLGLIIAPNGHLVTANSDPAASNDPNHPSELIELLNDGTVVSRLSIDANTGGAFGLATQLLGTVAWQLAFVNDNPVAAGKLTFRCSNRRPALRPGRPSWASSGCTRRRRSRPPKVVHTWLRIESQTPVRAGL